ncbi:MAG: hypothetical protein ACM31E_00940, partial [Fibrobacterota bacterium]|nr:hypothetical protein [Chitinispirillaceae bacterium]
MENLYSLKIKTRDKEYMMGIRFCFIVLIAFAAGASGQTVKSSIEFYDTITNKKMGEVGSSGSVTGSTFFIEENGTKRVVISKDTVSVDGHIKATSFTGNGSKLTGVTVDSISWDKIKNMPAGFADGVDNSGAASVDSVKRCAISDSSKTTGSVSWKNIKDIPTGFADGVDNAGSGEVPVIDSVRVSKVADSSKTVKDGSITKEKFALTMKINADSLGGVAASKFSQADHTHTGFYSKTETDAMMSTVNYSYSETTSYSVNGFNAGATIAAATITVNAPTSGKIIIIGNANVYFENASTGSYMIVGGIMNSMTASIEPNTILIGQAGIMMSWSQTRVFNVATGSHTFYLNFS